MQRPQDTAAPIKEADVDGLTLENTDRGAGEPVLLTHGGLCAALLDPLRDVPALGAATTGDGIVTAATRSALD